MHNLYLTECASQTRWVGAGPGRHSIESCRIASHSMVWYSPPRNGTNLLYMHNIRFFFKGKALHGAHGGQCVFCYKPAVVRIASFSQFMLTILSWKSVTGLVAGTAVSMYVVVDLQRLKSHTARSLPTASWFFLQCPKLHLAQLLRFFVSNTLPSARYNLYIDIVHNTMWPIFVHRSISMFNDPLASRSNQQEQHGGSSGTPSMHGHAPSIFLGPFPTHNHL